MTQYTAYYYYLQSRFEITPSINKKSLQENDRLFNPEFSSVYNRQQTPLKKTDFCSPSIGLTDVMFALVYAPVCPS